MPAGGKLSERDDHLGGFSQHHGRPIFDGALKVALAVALEQSPFLKVFPDERVRETLQMMQRSPDERMTQSLAREVARREQLKALVAGSIASLGSHYVLTLEAIEAETADVLARQQVEIAAKEQVLSSLGSASSKLREQLGESLAVIERYDVPLAQATTGSLEALHAYSLALDEGRMDPRPEAIHTFQRAIGDRLNFSDGPRAPFRRVRTQGALAKLRRSRDAPSSCETV
jgi:hypothetical protein